MIFNKYIELARFVGRLDDDELIDAKIKELNERLAAAEEHLKALRQKAADAGIFLDQEVSA